MNFPASKFLKEDLHRTEQDWKDGFFKPHSQPKIPVRYVLDHMRGFGKMRPRDPAVVIPSETYNPPVGPGWWGHSHELVLSNGQTIAIEKVHDADGNFRVGSADQVKEVLAKE